MIKKLKKTLLPGFGIVLLFIIVNAAVTFLSVETIAENSLLESKSEDLVRELLATLTAMEHAETIQRAFLITGDESFLQTYDEALGELQVRLDRIDELTLETPEQNAVVPALRSAVERKNGVMNDNVRIRREQGLDVIVSEGRMYRGRAAMNEVRENLNLLREAELRTLATRQAESADSNRKVLFTLILSNLVGIGLLFAAYYLIKGFIKERERRELELQEAHDALEGKVRERTEELSRANTELERSNRELQDFAFVASHDLQEPLRKIQAFGDRLVKVQGPKFDDQGRDYLSRMNSAAGRMHTLINDLLTFSRVTTKAQPFKRTDLNAIVQDVLGDLEVLIEKTGGRVAVDKLPTVMADSSQMRQLFQNLIGNALKFHRKEVLPVVTIRSEGLTGGNAGNGVGPSSCRIVVEDNGIGFDLKYLDRIFTPFQRLHGRGEYEGTGIGLAVCRKIVERHGGELTAESKSGEGSRFIITLPLKQEQEK